MGRFLLRCVDRRILFCLCCLSQTTFTTRAFDVLMQHPTPTTFFILPILLLLTFCFHRTAHDLGLGVSCLSCILNWYSCNDARLPSLPELQPRRRSKKRRSDVTPLTFVVIALVDESAYKISSLPTRLHHMSRQYQRDSGCAAMGVSVFFVSHNGCVTSSL